MGGLHAVEFKQNFIYTLENDKQLGMSLLCFISHKIANTL